MAGATVDLAVLGGTVVTPEGARQVGVAMAGGRIVAVGPEGELPQAHETIDAAGALVLPGAIDAHLHYDRDGRLTDRVDAASRSGVHGGVTFAVAFLLWQPDRRLTATRPDYTEAESIGRAATFGTAVGCPVYVVHLSSRLGLRRLLEARAAGQDVVAETCPQYLALTEVEMAHQGPLAKIAPPLRTEADREALWQATIDGELSVVASDHAPHPSTKKQVGWEDVFQSPFGAPSIETMLPLLHSEGVVRRGLSVEWLAWVSSDGPARMYGLYPRKGVIQVGADADLVVLDPGRAVTVDPANLHSNADYTPYEGRTLQGWPVVTVVGGEVLVRDGQLQRGAGKARFLARPKVTGRIVDRLRRPG